MVNVVSQQLPEPLTLDVIGSPETTRLVPGPNGEDLIIKEPNYSLQVVGVDADGWMVNVIVDRNSSELGERSKFTDWGTETVTSWVVQLLEAGQAG